MIIVDLLEYQNFAMQIDQVIVLGQKKIIYLKNQYSDYDKKSYWNGKSFSKAYSNCICDLI